MIIEDEDSKEKSLNTVVDKCDVLPRKIDILSYSNIIKNVLKDFVSILRSCSWSQLFYMFYKANEACPDFWLGYHTKKL